MQTYKSFSGYLTLMTPTWIELAADANYMKATALFKDTRTAFELAGVNPFDKPEILFDQERNVYLVVVLALAYREYVELTS